MSKNQINNVIDFVYDAALDHDWLPSLRAMERCFAAGHVVLMQHDILRGTQDVTGSDDRTIEMRYLEQYAPLNHAWPRLMRHTPGAPVTDAMLLDMEAHRSSLFFNEFLRPNGLVSMAGCILQRTPEMIVGISLSRPAHEPAFADEDLAVLAPVIPHLTRAFRLHRRLGQAEQAANNAWQILEQLRDGVVVVDGRGKLIQANHVADRILRRGDGLTLRRGRLIATDPPTDARLQKLLAERIRPRFDAAPDDVLRVERAADRYPYLIDCLPLQGPPAWSDATCSCVVLFIIDVGQVPPDAQRNLGGLFGLTPAEAALAIRIGNGEGLAGIADSIGVGLSTVRSHFAHILEKTGLHRQAEVARLVERVGGPLQHQRSPPPNG